jgi:DNA-binding GntR family transcriptional regulator
VGTLILDRQSVVPLYYQIQQSLLGQIRAGELVAGAPMPSEQEIATRLGVSRMTARQALKSLCSLGVAYSQRGKGTFVSAVKLEKNFRQVMSFSEEMGQRGSQPSSRVLRFETTEPNEEVKEALGLIAGEKIIRLKRVRLADSISLCIECTHLPLRFCPDLPEKYDPQTSLYQALGRHYGIQIELADEVAEASVATAEEAKLLRIRAKAPVFRFTRTAFLRSGQPIEFVKSAYRGDRCRVVNRLSRQMKQLV